jgi:xanthine dehydrogenase accessory factor
MHDTLAIFQFLADHSAQGEAVAIVTLTATTGPSSRDPGAHMAVSETGAYVGSFSGGCIEAAVVSEARDALALGEPRLVRFGAGSPFIDIRLPCGGGVELLISPCIANGFANHVLDLLQKRVPIDLSLSLAHPPVATQGSGDRNSALRVGEEFRVHHAPPLRIVLLGNGAQVERLYALAGAFGTQIEVFTPDRESAARITAQGGHARVLHTLAQASEFTVDRWTACVCLFHDHNWEPLALRHAVEGGAFYVGAMGSRTAARTRNALLADAGMDPADIAQVRGPIGMMQGSRDPNTLALSVLAEMIDAYNQRVMPQSD